MKYALPFLFAAASVVACGSSEQMPGPVGGSGGHAGGSGGGGSSGDHAGAGGSSDRAGSGGPGGHGGSATGGGGATAGHGGAAGGGDSGGQAGAVAGHGGSAGHGGTAGGAGAGGHAGAAGSAGGTGGAVAFAPVQAIFDQYCTRCHDPAHPVVPETQTYVEMPLVASASYDALVGVAAHETCGGTRVVAGDPDHSYLYRKVADAQPCDGERMPHRGMLAVSTPLSAADVATIRAWIAGGAHR